MNDQSRAFVAVALSAVVLFSWQYFFGSKTVEENVKQVKVTQTANPIKQGQTANTTKANNVTGLTDSSPVNIEYTELAFEGDAVQAIITSKGEIYNVSDYNKNDRTTTSVTGSEKPLKIGLYEDSTFKGLNLTLEKVGNRIVAKDPSKNLVIEFYEEDKLLNINYRSDKAIKLQYLFSSVPYDQDKEPNISYRYGLVREYVIYTTEAERMEVNDHESFPGTSMKWAMVDFDYYLFGLIFPQKDIVTYATNGAGQLTLTSVAAQTAGEVRLVFASKNYDNLDALGSNLTAAVDFGFFGFIAVPILRVLQFFHEYFPNYGVAIILLTIAFKLLTFPLMFKSFKSMKKMQKLQPDLAKLKEKHKEDPQRVQKETMELFKKHGANPLGGCLPMLLQLPLFFAFYRVLYNSVELVNAPFILWIKDLSIKDPYYVLPIAMCLAMLLQQKFTPSPSADPVQKKVMLFMPLIFGFFMKDLPSGLSLYILVSTLFGIGQQFLVYRMID